MWRARGEGLERPRRGSPWVLSLACSALALWTAAWLSPSLAVGPVAAYVVAFLAVCGSALASGATFPLWTVPEVLAVTGLGLLALLVTPTAPASAGLAVLITLALLATCTSLGSALGARIDRPGHLLAVALVSSLADLWSVFDAAGPSAQLAESIEVHGPEVLSLFVLPWPMLGSDLLMPVLGAGDVVFMALYLAAARSHGLSLGRMLGALSVGCALALLLVLLTERPLPLLPLLGACVALGVPEARHLETRERRVLVLAVAGIALALLVRSV